MLHEEAGPIRLDHMTRYILRDVWTQSVGSLLPSPSGVLPNGSVTLQNVWLHDDIFLYKVGVRGVERRHKMCLLLGSGAKKKCGDPYM